MTDDEFRTLIRFFNEGRPSPRNLTVNVSARVRERTFINGRLVSSNYPLTLAERIRWVWLPRLRRRVR